MISNNPITLGEVQNKSCGSKDLHKQLKKLTRQFPLMCFEEQINTFKTFYIQVLNVFVVYFQGNQIEV